MATLVSHAVAAASLGAALPASSRKTRLVVAGALGSVVPDVDVLWSGWDGAPDWLSHRGLTHSLSFALALAIALAATNWLGGATRREKLGAALWLFVAIASHGVLDAMTDGGEGVAFLAPFSVERWFLPWRPIVVSPVIVGGMLPAWRDWWPEFVVIARTELEWIVVPSLAFASGVGVVRALQREGVARRAAWKPAAVLVVVVASLAPIRTIRTIRPTRPPMELAVLLHSSELVVVARVDAIDPPPPAPPATTTDDAPWVRVIDEVHRSGRRVHATVLETLKGAPARPFEYFSLTDPDGATTDAIVNETDLFLFTDAARGSGDPPALVILARLELVEKDGRRDVVIPSDRILVEGAPRRTLPFDELQRMIAASTAPARPDDDK